MSTETEIEEALLDLKAFAESDGFQNILEELYNKDIKERAYFVKSVLINRNLMNERGIQIPESIKIQRSVFFDGRKHLFGIVKELKDGSKVALNFDEEKPTSEELTK